MKEVEDPAADSTATGDGRDEVATKLERVRSWLSDNRHTAALFSSQANFAWLTAGGSSQVSLGDARGVASILVTPDASYVIAPNIERRRIADEEISGLPFEVVDYPWHRPADLYRAVTEVCDSSRAVTDLPSAALPSAPGDLARLRFQLLAPEIDRYRVLGKDAAHAVESACRNVEPGASELDVAALVAQECQRRDVVALVNLVAADGRIAAYRHPIPTHAKLHDTLLVALTGRRGGLHASLTRMAGIAAVDDDFRRRHAAVARVDAGMILASRPDASLADVFDVAVHGYDREGFADEWRLHHQGGLTGYAGREIFATPAERFRLGPNQAVAWNPSITRVKSEDTVLVTERGFEVLTDTGEWPVEDVEVAGGVVGRPAVLEKGAS